jgi:hypothetical protein
MHNTLQNKVTSIERGHAKGVSMATLILMKTLCMRIVYYTFIAYRFERGGGCYLDTTYSLKASTKIQQSRTYYPLHFSRSKASTPSKHNTSNTARHILRALPMALSQRSLEDDYCRSNKGFRLDARGICKR